ncbi:MAG TPA: hypothetical protein VF153_05305 [Candidatus Limnocylindria bacterium]
MSRQRPVIHMLLACYPPAWRTRYGQELADLIAEGPVTPRVALDVASAGIRQRMHAARLALTRGTVMTIGPAWRHPTAFAVIGAILLLPTFAFVGASLLGYELGITAVRGVIEPVAEAMNRSRIVDLLLVAAPPLAFVAAIAPLIRFGVERRDGALEAVVAVRTKLLNVIIGLVALLLAGLLIWHIVVESVLQLGA